MPWLLNVTRVDIRKYILQPESFADIDKSSEMLNFKPTTNVDVGIEKLIKWYKEFHKC